MSANKLGRTHLSNHNKLTVTSYITSMSISPTGTFMAFGDADGTIHMMSQAEEGSNMPFNGFDGQPITWIDAPERIPETEWIDSTWVYVCQIPLGSNTIFISPLNTIGLPHFDSQLFSAWTPLLAPTDVSYPPPPKIPSQILGTMKINDSVAYAAMPKELKGRRNMSTAASRKPNSRFRSGHLRQNDVRSLTIGLKCSLMRLQSPGSSFHDVTEEVPAMYRKVEIEYSKFGVEDFDFGSVSGLWEDTFCSR